GGGVDLAVAVAAQVAPALVVGEDQDDVGAPRRRGRRRQRGGGGQGGGPRQHEARRPAPQAVPPGRFSGRFLERGMKGALMRCMTPAHRSDSRVPLRRPSALLLTIPLKNSASPAPVPKAISFSQCRYSLASRLIVGSLGTGSGALT